jgi:hypothetical protein
MLLVLFNLALSAQITTAAQAIATRKLPDDQMQATMKTSASSCAACGLICEMAVALAVEIWLALTGDGYACRGQVVASGSGVHRR